MTDIENLSPHKMRLQQRKLGQLVRVDELPEKQVAELFGALKEKECTDAPSSEPPAEEAEANTGAGLSFASVTSQASDSKPVEAQKLVVTDPQERIQLLRKQVNWEKSNATNEQKEEFFNKVLIGKGDGLP